ncbi:MAG: hypothetical protein IPK16_06865 [Anaerolineales bacterium]|nr:hypothetical protein [Anaerolineales bacterium]
MTGFFGVLFSPIGPVLVLLAGALVELLAGRWLRRPGALTAIALAFAGFATVIFLSLQFQNVIPTFSQPWRPLLQNPTNLLWIADGWNYYVAGLILLLGSLGILLDRSPAPAPGRASHLPALLAANLTVLAASILFVNSGNLLTVLLTWVFLDLAILLRAAAEPTGEGDVELGKRLRNNETRVLSLIGAVLLLIGLLPAGATGPALELARGTAPVETLILMLAAAAIRAGIYPFHLWLLPRARSQLNMSERLLDQMVPVLGGLWLFGWTFKLGAAALMQTPWVLGLLTLMLLLAAIAAWTAEDQLHHVTFVLIGSAGLAVLVGALADNPGPAGMLWAVTAFALGGGLWLVGDQAWRAWGWQLPVSIGALALAGVVFTPGFLSMPAVAKLITNGPLFWPVFVVYVLAGSVQVAALLRSWSMPEFVANHTMTRDYVARLLAAILALGLPLAIAGILPAFAETVAGIPNAIPASLGDPPSAVAAPQVWVVMVLPLLLGLGLVWLRPRLWPELREWPNRVSRFTQLEWFFRFAMWSIDRLALIGENGLRVVEGAGYVGWVLAFVLLALLLVR